MKDEFVLFSNHHNFMKMSIPLYNKRIRDREIGINQPFVDKTELIIAAKTSFIYCIKSWKSEKLSLLKFYQF